MALPRLSKLAYCWFALATPVLADGTSFQIEGSYGVWGNQDGGNGIVGFAGLDGTDTRSLGSFSLGVARDFSDRFTGAATVAATSWSEASPSLDDDDATRSTVDLTLRGFWSASDTLRFGGFFGFGEQNDYGDSDLDMAYAYLGADATLQTGFGHVFGQIGFFDSSDEYNEGTQDAPFVRFGGAYDLGSNYALTGALSWAGGKKYSVDASNRTYNVELGIERKFEYFTGFAAYEWTQISFKDSGTRYGDTFETLSIGVRMTFGGTADHGPKIAPIGRWVAYNANEIE